MNLSKSKIIAFRQCPKRLWLELHRPELRDDSGSETAFQIGHSVGEIARRIYVPNGEGTTINIATLGHERALATSAELLANCDAPIFEAGVAANGALAYADVMLPERLEGRPAWKMIEIKSSTKIKDYHREDLAIQTYIATAAGIRLTSVALAHIDSTFVYPGNEDYRGLLKENDLTAETLARTAEVPQWIADAQQIAAQTEEPNIATGPQCFDPFPCGFSAYCNREKIWPEYPVSSLPHIRGTKVAMLENLGFHDLRHVPDEHLSDLQARVKEHTQANTVFFDAAGAASDLAPYGFPAYFLDFETVQFAVPIWAGTSPYAQIPFQFSLHILQENGELTHHSFLDLSGNDPTRHFAQTLIDLSGHFVPVFVYNATFENRILHETAARFPEYAPMLEAILTRIVDLLPIAKARYYHPSQQGSWSLKAVLPAAIPDLSYEQLEGIQDGGTAAQSFIEAITPTTTLIRKQEIENHLLSYCHLDSFAMVRLWQVFSKNITMIQDFVHNLHKTQTSEFESISIFDALGRIGNLERPLYLPAIQRHFVWRMDKICRLFDSMMRGYPIGTFLFWEVADVKRNDYAFYEFMRDFSRHADECFNRTAPRTLPKNVTGVLDGQQRLNSMYVALQGSYSEFIGGQGNHKSKRECYPRREFHLNVFFEPDEQTDSIYKFAFLQEWEALPERFDEQTCWFPVHTIYHCGSVEEVENEWHTFAAKMDKTICLAPERVSQVLETLNLLWRRIRKEALITYFPIRNRDLTEALQIFIRANNGGTHVTDAEMIFSTIVAHWPGGREKIEGFQRSINDTGKCFEFDITHVMLACLVLSGCPVRLKIESFKPSHVDKIKNEWEQLTRILHQAVQLADDWGLSGNNAVNPNAIIALGIFLKKGIRINTSKEDLRIFVLKSLVCDVYRRGERALALIRDYADSELREGSDFNLGEFESKFELPSGQRMEVTHDTLDQLLMLHKDDRKTYVLLSLLHGQHALHEQAFQKDHIHPHSGFDDLSQLNLDWERAAKWHEWKNQLPNIQLLQGEVNNVKRAKPLNEWLPIHRPDEAHRKHYLLENDIPTDVSLEFAEFESFFEKRKEMLRQKLISLLNVPNLLFVKNV